MVEDLGVRGNVSDFFNFFGVVDGEELNIVGKGMCNVLFFFDCIVIRNVCSVCVGC